MGISELGIRKIFIETTNYCNFSCESCPLLASRREKQHMQIDLLRRTIDEIARHNICDAIAFNLLGEPLMYPHLVAAVRHCRERGLRCEINSNGSLLTPVNVRLLVEAGLNRLTISLRRYGEADHRQRGAPMRFDRYYQGILEAIGCLNQRAGQTRIALMFMGAATGRRYEVDLPIMQEDRAAFERDLLAVIQDVYAAVGIETAAYERELRAAAGKLSTSPAFLYRINERTMVGARPLPDWGNAVTSGDTHPAGSGLCGLAFSSLSILSNGAVTMCCADTDGRASLGNVNDRPLVEILAPERIQAARRAMRATGRQRICCAKMSM